MRMMIKSLLHVICCGLSWWATTGSFAASPVPHFLWSTSPLDAITLTETDVWTDMFNTSITLTLVNEAMVEIFYDAVVMAHQREIIGDGNLVLDQYTNEDLKSVSDALGFRLLVNGVSFRQSGARTGPLGFFETDSTTVAGALVTSLGPGTHVVQLQWKAFGSQVVSRWSIDPNRNAGFSGGRTLVVNAQHRVMWSTQPLSQGETRSREWTLVRHMELSFVLVDTTTLRCVYYLPVTPDVISADLQFDDLETVLEVDGVQYRESASSVQYQMKSITPGIVTGNVMVHLAAGAHVVKLLWRKSGPSERSWRTNPSVLDGFTAGRALVVTGETFDTKSVEHLVPATRAQTDVWSDVGPTVLHFHLHTPSTVLLQYHLPVSQQHHPSFETWGQDQWDQIATRLVVDGKAYRHGASSVDGGKVHEQAQGSLVLALGAGSHTARLQWEKTDDRMWHSITNYAADGLSGDGNLFVLMNSWNNQPTIVLPQVEPIVGTEDETLEIVGLEIHDIDSLVVPDYAVALKLQVNHGRISLASTQGLSFSNGDGLEDEFVFATGNLASVNAALKSVSYVGQLDWSGKDELLIFVSDQSNIGFGIAALKAEQKLAINIQEQNDPPTLSIPSMQSLAEDSSIHIYGISIYDADDEPLFVKMSVSAGKLSIKSSADLTFSSGSGVSSQSMAFTGSSEAINMALQEIVYIPDADFNSLQHTEKIEIIMHDRLNDAEKRQSASGIIPIQVNAQNDLPEFILPSVHSMILDAYKIESAISKDIKVSIQAATATAKLTLKTTTNLDFTTGQDSPGRHLEFSASIESTQAAIDELTYTQPSDFRGTDLIFLRFQFADGTGKVEENAVHLHWMSTENKTGKSDCLQLEIKFQIVYLS